MFTKVSFSGSDSNSFHFKLFYLCIIIYLPTQITNASYAEVLKEHVLLLYLTKSGGAHLHLQFRRPCAVKRKLGTKPSLKIGSVKKAGLF